MKYRPTRNHHLGNHRIHSPRLISFLFRIGLLLAGTLLIFGCDASTTPPPDGSCPIFQQASSTQNLTARTGDATIGEWVDLGLISGAERIGGLVLAGDDILLATNDGLWRRPVGIGGDWVRSGLEGRDVLALAAVEGTAIVFAGTAPLMEDATPALAGAQDPATLFRSDDGGATWEPAAEGLFDAELEVYDPVEYLAVEPGSSDPRLFGNLSGSTIAHSDDGGSSWRVIRGELGGFGYPCPIHVAESDPNTLFQGCEAPLDFAWIRSFDIGASELHDVGEGCEIVGIDQISNRRPNVLTSFEHAPGRLYAGLEGAVIVIDANGWDWIWRTDGMEDDETSEALYTYVKFIWIDPADSDHMVFGGGDGPPGEDTRSGLYETFDGGQTVDPIDAPEGVDFTDGGVRAGVPVNDGADFVIAHLPPEGARVFLRRHE